MMDNYGNVLNYNDFCLKHGFACHPKEFYTIVNAIPKNIVLLVKGILSHYSVTLSLLSPSLGELSIRGYKYNNRYIRSILLIDFFQTEINVTIFLNILTQRR